MLLHSLSSFLDKPGLMKDNKREAERLPYNRFLLYDRRGGVPSRNVASIATVATHDCYFKT